MKQSIKQNLILVIMTVMTLVATFFIGLGITMPSVVALEQDARCGITEHVHRDDCYLNNVLICGEKAHTHGENCYLLRLEDNDINRLLSEIEADEEKSLEHVITNVVYEASYLELVSEGLLPAPTPTPTPTPTPLLSLLPAGSSLDSLTATNEGVANLNRSITDNNITPTIYLNERLITPASEGEPVPPDKNLINLIEGETSPTNLVTYAADNSTDNSGISTLALGDTPSNNVNDEKVNVYINLDGTEQFIGTVARQSTTVQSGSGCDATNTTYYEANLSDISTELNACGIQISATDLNSTYNFKYTTGTNSTSSNAEPAEKVSPNNVNRVRFGSDNTVYNVYLTDVNFYTVTLNYNQITGYTGTNPETKYLESTKRLSSLNLNAEYDWYDAETGGSKVNQNITISQPTTLYARPKTITATFKNTNGAITNPGSIESEEPHASLTFTMPEYTASSAPHIWVVDGTNGNNYYEVGAQLTIYADTTFVAVPATYTITFKNSNGELFTPPYLYPDYNASITFPNLNGGYMWVGSDGSIYPGGATSAPIRANLTFTAMENIEVVYEGINSTTTESVGVGTTVTIPENTSGYVWVCNGRIYRPGENVTITQKMVFTEKAAITVKYELNFTGTNVMETPQIVGESTQLIAEGTSITASVVSPRDAGRLPSGGSAVSYYFNHWTASGNGNTLNISPGASVRYEDLASMAVDGVVKMTGNWSSGTSTNSTTRTNVVIFYIGKNSQPPDFGGNNPTTQPSQYTGAIYTAYVGNPPSNTNFKLDDKTPDNSYAVDKEIRALVGEKTNELWISSIPSDEEVFAALVSYAQNGELTADGETVDPDKLDSDHYAVRWYVFKSDTDRYNSNDNGWHIDGRLVKKEGTIRVSKTFQGDADILSDAKSEFYIEASYDETEIALYIYPNAVSGVGSDVEKLAPTSVSGNTYEWLIEHVGVDQHWTITEHIKTDSTQLGNYAVYSEYTVYDSSGQNEAALGEYGSKVTVEAVTQAPDEGEQHMLRVDFSNYYLRNDAIALKKEDGATGKGLAGVKFVMYHKNMSVPLRFKGSAGNYEKADDGSITELETDANGYITISGFSYDRDMVVFKEVAPPAGYSQAPDVTLMGSGDDNNITVSIVEIGGEATSGMTPEAVNKTAEYYEKENILVIKDYSVQNITVTAVKKWEVDSALQTDTVTVELYADGQIASTLLPGIPKVSVDLKKSEGYQYTWTDLPLYIDGRKVAYSIKETKVGSERLSVNGNFVNWIDTYNRYETFDADGNLSAVTLEVCNDTRRTMLKVEKTDTTGLVALPDAQFSLEQVVQNGNTFGKLAGGISTVGVTDAQGWITFDNLTPGYYKLTEIQPPPFCIGLDSSIVLYVDASGKIERASIVGGSIVLTTDGNMGDGLSRPSDFVVRVPNIIAEPLPETGGVGTHIYTAGGLLLMAAAMALLIYRRKRRKEADLLDV